MNVGAKAEDHSMQSLGPEAIKAKIRAKVTELAAALGSDASGLEDAEIIPFTGLLDSAALLELVVWLETEFELSLEQRDVNIENLGSLNAMASFLMTRKASQ
jgi:acyl carrier protein